MTAALHLVPDPDDAPPPPDTAGEHHPVPEPAPAPAVEQEPGEELHDADEPGEELDDEEDEAPAPRRALAMPDLRPYADLAWIPAVINAGLEGARRWRQRAPERKAARRAAKAEAQAAGEPVGRARLVAMAADYLAGTRLLIGYLIAWMSGEYGPKDMKVPARLAAVGFAGYCGYRTATSWPVWGPVGLFVVYCAAALGALHRQRAEQGKKRPAPAATKGVAKGSPKAATKDDQEPAEEAAEQAPARRSLWSRLTSTEAPADTPAQEPTDSPDEAPDEGEEEAPAEAPAEPPARPSREVIARALHHHYRGGSGVLLTTLRQHLSLPHTRAVREALGGAGIRMREGVRTPGGNGPGVHTHDFPPLPPSPGEAQGDGVDAGQEPTTTMPTPGEGGQKGLGVDDTYWPSGRDYHFEPDPTNPHGTRIVYHRGEQ